MNVFLFELWGNAWTLLLLTLMRQVVYMHLTVNFVNEFNTHASVKLALLIIRNAFYTVFWYHTHGAISICIRQDILTKQNMLLWWNRIQIVIPLIGLVGFNRYLWLGKMTGLSHYTIDCNSSLTVAPFSSKPLGWRSYLLSDPIWTHTAL